uniref:Ras GTPase-activating protein-binding protein 1-like isoform X1 n=1 Tax=Tanacetum cinerariifolium TaxID=118510 RepID=A0A699K9G9_TANCI|nr:Ras GTPase-activating protein-binding protein 1-like isoform X1 [Tanacetum cinerariifolium]
MKMKHNVVPVSSPVPAPKKPQPKKQEQPPVNNAPTTVVAAEPVASSAESVQNGNHEEEAEGYSVYIKGLPISVTQAMLEEEFKKFGPIKPNGIQVRSNRMQGFSFGFVEFEVPEAVQKAIEASPIPINGHQAIVEEKRSTMSRVPLTSIPWFTWPPPLLSLSYPSPLPRFDAPLRLLPPL